jgi:hypothetical protein
LHLPGVSAEDIAAASPGTCRNPMSTGKAAARPITPADRWEPEARGRLGLPTVTRQAWLVTSLAVRSACSSLTCGVCGS